MSLASLLTKFTNQQLRAELSAQGLSAPKSARKGDLIALLEPVLLDGDAFDAKIQKSLDLFRKAAQRRKFMTWAALPDRTVTRYLSVLASEPMGLDPRKELIYAAAKFGYLSGFQGDLDELQALLLYSMRELAEILKSQDQTPEKIQFERIYQILRTGAVPYREFYPLESFSTMTRGDWDALQILFGENPLEALVEEGMMDPVPMEMTIEDLRQGKLVDLVQFAQTKGFLGTVAELKQICPKLQRIELQRYLGGRDRETHTIVDIFGMNNTVLVERLLRAGVVCHTEMPGSWLRAALIYATAVPNLVPRRPKRRTKFTELDHALRLAGEGTLTDLDRVMLPENVDRILIEQELRNLAEFENPISTMEYAQLRTLDSSSIQAGLSLFQLPNVGRLTRPQLLFMLVHRQLPPGTDLDGLEERYNRVADLLSAERAALMMLYGTSEMSTVMNAPETPVSRLLYQVIGWRKENQRQKIRKFADRKGVLMPTRLYESSNWTQQYLFILSDFAQYGPILDRSSEGPWSMEEQTDLELAERFGVVPVYASRTDLIMAYQNPAVRFWIPVNVEMAQNTESPLMLDDLDNDTEGILYAVGTRDQFWVIPVEELQELIRRSRDRRIPNPFPDSTRGWAMSDALPVAEDLEDDPTVRLLNSKLGERLPFVASDYTPDQQMALARVFRKMVEAAMYMRRWQGPGTPYPLAADETVGRNINMNAIFVTLADIETLIDQSGIRYVFDRLTTMYSTFSQYSLRQILSGVGAGTYCIRMASGDLVRSGIGYLTLLDQTFEDPVRGRIITTSEVEGIV